MVGGTRHLPGWDVKWISRAMRVYIYHVLVIWKQYPLALGTVSAKGGTCSLCWGQYPL